MNMYPSNSFIDTPGEGCPPSNPEPRKAWYPEFLWCCNIVKLTVHFSIPVNTIMNLTKF